ncbi:hypothetical protein GALL_452540 [mine drainage metagenome]|uniref:Uncharacterized protein n=1 Tax=mine drainage metagenome TaxID=410659 RepID=A0A1J5PZ69_9ZZZZ
MRGLGYPFDDEPVESLSSEGHSNSYARLSLGTLAFVNEVIEESVQMRKPRVDADSCDGALTCRNSGCPPSRTRSNEFERFLIGHADILPCTTVMLSRRRKELLK